MGRVSKRCVLVLAGLLTAGCNQARFVHKDEWGGVVAIPHNTNQWPDYNRKHAEELMTRQCPRGYVIEGEDEVVTGQVNEVHIEGNRDSLASGVLGIGEEHRTTNSRNITEWRIRYRAKDAPVSLKPLQLTALGQLQAPDPTPVQELSVASAPELPKEPVPVPAAR